MNSNCTTTPRGYVQRKSRRGPIYRPASNIRKTENCFYIDMALPSWSKKEIQLKVEEGVLTVDGKFEKISADGFIYKTRRFRKLPFQRSFTLGKSVDTEKITADMKNGILTIMLPLNENVSQKIKIK